MKAFIIICAAAGGMVTSLKRTAMATALRIYCAERTPAMQPMQHTCMYTSRLAPFFHRTFVSGMTWAQV